MSHVVQRGPRVMAVWTRGVDAQRHFYWRQLRDMKARQRVGATNANSGAATATPADRSGAAEISVSNGVVFWHSRDATDLAG